MTNKRIYKCLSGIGLAILLSGAMMLIGCSEEKKESHGAFFKISVKTEDFGTTELTRAAGEAKMDTIITPLGNNCYIETIYGNEKVQVGMTRSTPVLAGTTVNVLAYDKDDKFKGKLTGTVGANGSVTAPEGQLRLEPGTYSFVCLANAEFNAPNNLFNVEKGKNCMSAVIQERIGEGDQECLLDFVLSHNTGKIKFKVHAVNGLFNNLSATLKTQNNTCPISQQVDIPSMSRKDYMYGTMDDKHILKGNGVDLESNEDFYYITNYNYTTESEISLFFPSGTLTFGFNSPQDITGTTVPLKFGSVLPNRVHLVTLNFRQRETGYAFTVGQSNISVPYDGGGIDENLISAVTSTYNTSSTSWSISRVSTTPPNEYGSDYSAYHDGIVTDFYPSFGNTCDNGDKPRFVLSKNWTGDPRIIYVRLTQNQSNEHIDLIITQAANTTLHKVEFSATTGGKVTNEGDNWVNDDRISTVSSTAVANPHATFLGWYHFDEPVNNTTGVTVNGNTITINPSLNEQRHYKAKFSYDGGFDKWENTNTIASGIHTPTGTMTLEEACKLLSTPNSILFDLDGAPYAYYTNSRVSDAKGWWILKKEYWNPTIIKQPTGPVTIKRVTHEQALSGRYYFVPALFYGGFHGDNPTNFTYYTLAGQGAHTDGNDFVLNSFPVYVPDDNRSLLGLVMNNYAYMGWVGQDHDQGYALIKYAGDDSGVTSPPEYPVITTK